MSPQRKVQETDTEITNLQVGHCNTSSGSHCDPWISGSLFWHFAVDSTAASHDQDFVQQDVNIHYASTLQGGK